MGTYRSSIPNRGNSHFHDFDGSLVDAKYEDEVITHVWDLTDLLASGESVSSTSYEAQSGLTVNSETLATPIVTYEITKTGVLEVAATLSSGRVLKERFAWQPREEGASDYR